jgi:hypothetical protein
MLNLLFCEVISGSSTGSSHALWALGGITAFITAISGLVAVLRRNNNNNSSNNNK